MYIYFMLLEPSKKELRALPNSSHRNTCILPNYEIRADLTRSSVILYKTWTRTYPSERKNRGWRKTRIAVNERSLPGSRRERKKGEGISCELVGRVGSSKASEANLFATPTTEKRECLYRAAFNLTSLEALV